jgi:hypothetical protein
MYHMSTANEASKLSFSSSHYSERRKGKVVEINNCLLVGSGEPMINLKSQRCVYNEASPETWYLGLCFHFWKIILLQQEYCFYLESVHLDFPRSGSPFQHQHIRHIQRLTNEGFYKSSISCNILYSSWPTEERLLVPVRGQTVWVDYTWYIQNNIPVP